MNQEPTLNEPGLQACIVFSSELPGSGGKRKYKVSLKKPAFFPIGHLFVRLFNVLISKYLSASFMPGLVLKCWKSQEKCINEINLRRLGGSVNRRTPDFSSGHDPRVGGPSPASGSALTVWTLHLGILPFSLSLFPSPSCASLSLKRNKLKKKEQQKSPMHLLSHIFLWVMTPQFSWLLCL